MINRLKNQVLDLSVIILTFNEELHLRRCINSFFEITDDILILDSFSNDRTKEIADEFGAHFYQRKFISQSDQLSWAITNLNFKNNWILRIDADEYLSPELLLEIKAKFNNLSSDINGICLKRYINFQGQLIRYGGLFPKKVLRIFKKEYGFCEDRLMDEHLMVKGRQINFNHHLIDENLNSLTWWIEKHNNYATREALEVLNLKYKFKPLNIQKKIGANIISSRTQFLKNYIYLKTPFQFRSLLYFIYRYLIRLGFLDGIRGFTFHFLQAFWYRYLVDAKIYEFENQLKNSNLSKEDVLYKLFNYLV